MPSSLNITPTGNEASLQMFLNESRSNNNYELKLKFDFLLSSYFDRHSDVSLCQYWEDYVLGWNTVKKTNGCVYHLLSTYLLTRFNYDVYSDLDDQSVRELSLLMKDMKIFYRVPNKRDVWLEYTVNGLLKNAHEIMIEYETYPNKRRRGSLFLYYVEKESYIIEKPKSRCLDTATSNKTVPLPIELCAIKINTVELGTLSKRTREVMKKIASLTDREYKMLKDILIRSFEFNLQEVDMYQPIS